MGCDIHQHLEVKDINGKWHSADLIMNDLFGSDTHYCDDFPISRDYNLFAILEKDHPRNYSNIAESIAEQRGVPKDSPYYEDYTSDEDLWGGSYVTAKEIFTFADQHPTIECSGYVSKEDYEGLKSGKIKAPKMYWQGGSSDNTHYHAKWDEISPIVYLAGYLSYVMQGYKMQLIDVKWEHDLDEKTQAKMDDWFDHASENIRLVFAFDN